MPKHLTEMSEKNCLECSTPLGPGRSDRKFCNDICRTAYNNKRRSEVLAEPLPDYTKDPEQMKTDQEMRNILKIQDILLNNRIKLYDLYHLYEQIVPLNEFYGFGVNLKWFTNLYTDDYYGLTFRMCFDFGYHIKDDHAYIIWYPNEIIVI
jgi:hypothetical protein